MTVSLKLTVKQFATMEIVLKGNVNAAGVTISWCDTDQVIERLPYKARRESMIQMMRNLESRGFVERRIYSETRRGRRRSVYAPTDLAFDILRPQPMLDEENVPPVLENSGDS